MAQSNQTHKEIKREASSEDDISSSPRPPPSPWASETSTSTSLPSQPPPHPPQQTPCNPKRLACEIQACFKKRGFEDPSRCAAEFDALRLCCSTLAEESLHCSEDWRGSSSSSEKK